MCSAGSFSADYDSNAANGASHARGIRPRSTGWGLLAQTRLPADGPAPRATATHCPSWRPFMGRSGALFAMDLRRAVLPQTGTVNGQSTDPRLNDLVLIDERCWFLSFDELIIFARSCNDDNEQLPKEMSPGPHVSEPPKCPLVFFSASDGWRALLEICRRARPRV